ncbi:MAG: glucose-6-phosphate isomerase [Anaerolineae bacterium]|nr:glucose-6-phosphate isomerase [Anaerolineae bacterium]
MDQQRPLSFEVALPGGVPAAEAEHTVRRLSDMAGYYADAAQYRAMLDAGDPVLYDVYEIARPEVAGELRHGTSVLHPGKVGAEYYMTKGHYHARLETGEVYYCLQGRGMMVMQTPEGEWAVEPLQRGAALYVPPRWAHRSVNVAPDEDLVTFYVYPADAGHDYGAIQQRGFRVLIVEQDGEPRVIENPRWQGGERPAHKGSAS